MRWVFLSFAVAVLALSLLTVVRAWNVTVWKLALLAGEYGQLLAVAALVVVCLAVAHGVVMVGDEGDARGQGYWRVTGAAIALTLVAVALLFSPTVYAALIGQRLPDKLANAFGGRIGSRQVLDFSALFAPWRRPVHVPVTTRVFAHDGTPEALALDFYALVPTGDAPMRAPCVVVIHGGGWDSGDRLQLTEFNHWLAGRGYAVAAIDYRLAPRWPWPAQREDTLAAIAWLKAHAAELGIDPQRFVLLGRSAGAQIAAAVAYGAPDPAVRGVVGLYGVYDMEFVWSIARTDDVLNSVKLMQHYLGGEPTAANQPAYDSASAQGLVRPGRTPPTLLLHGTIDTLCWVEHSRRLDARLAAAGVPHALVELPWAVHAFDYNFTGPGGQLTGYAVERFLATVTAPGAP